jgi:biopolymer transport protein TolR
MAMVQGGREKRGGKLKIMSEINVTPLVDVMLVLLIIFMVTSPMMVAGVNVDLPQTSAAPLAGQDEPLTISIDKKGIVYILETPVERENLGAKLSAITKAKMDTRIFVRGDKSVSYGDIVDVVSEITMAGFTKVALITQVKQYEKK